MKHICLASAFFLLVSGCIPVSKEIIESVITVEGRVLDSRNNPISNARVEVMRVSGSEGNMVVKGVKQCMTNEDSFYSLHLINDIELTRDVFGQEQLNKYIDYFEVRFTKDGFTSRTQSWTIRNPKDPEMHYERDVSLNKSAE